MHDSIPGDFRYKETDWLEIDCVVEWIESLFIAFNQWFHRLKVYFHCVWVWYWHDLQRVRDWGKRKRVNLLEWGTLLSWFWLIIFWLAWFLFWIELKWLGCVINFNIVRVLTMNECYLYFHGVWFKSTPCISQNNSHRVKSLVLPPDQVSLKTQNIEIGIFQMHERTCSDTDLEWVSLVVFDLRQFILPVGYVAFFHLIFINYNRMKQTDLLGKVRGTVFNQILN